MVVTTELQLRPLSTCQLQQDAVLQHVQLVRCSDPGARAAGYAGLVPVIGWVNLEHLVKLTTSSSSVKKLLFAAPAAPCCCLLMLTPSFHHCSLQLLLLSCLTQSYERCGLKVYIGLHQTDWEGS